MHYLMNSYVFLFAQSFLGAHSVTGTGAPAEESQRNSWHF